MSEGFQLPFKEREINGTVYKAHVLKLDQWAALTEDLAGILGEPLSSFLRGDVALSEGVSVGALAIGALGTIGSKLSARSILALSGHMAKSLRVNGKILSKDAQNLYWPGHMKDLAPVVGLFLEAQYGDFYEGLDAALPEGEQDLLAPSEKDSDG